MFNQRCFLTLNQPCRSTLNQHWFNVDVSWNLVVSMLIFGWLKCWINVDFLKLKQPCESTYNQHWFRVDVGCKLVVLVISLIFFIISYHPYIYFKLLLNFHIQCWVNVEQKLFWHFFWLIVGKIFANICILNNFNIYSTLRKKIVY